MAKKALGALYSLRFIRRLYSTSKTLHVRQVRNGRLYVFFIASCCEARTTAASNSSGGKRNADQSGQRLRTDFPHNRGAMIVHRPLAYLQVRRDVLARASSQNLFEDLALARGEGLDFRSRNSPICRLCRASIRVIQSILNAVEQLVRANRLLQEIEGARLHRSHGYGDITIGRYHDDREGKLHPGHALDKVEAAKAGHSRIDKQAPRLIR